ncbi:nucleotidyltransferase [Sporomusa malonica]|uniref:tRNA(Met) cytidine acetate ligase n=1 Tax=Sporomusa malonica TaxID=112901 RepID=A0A1W2B2Y3_9FIRM|nr:nucleotidyltransferase [Sporomusa malonica]SMC67296.1 Predicted nucleotidyltransferase [Sporomusa malonica]
MNVVGMIVEYNPFHNGHLWHLNEARRISGAQFAIGIMSGNFLQRGEPAMINKWSRAAMAVKAGVDLVIELPVVFSVRSAQYFATGGVQLLGRLGIVSHICFGAETADLSLLIPLAKALSENDIVNTLRKKMKTGQTYAASLALTLSDSLGIDPGIIQSPNNILAIEYLRAINTYTPHLTPLPIKRLSSNYHDNVITSNIASATAIRASIAENRILPPDSIGWKTVPPACAEQINTLITTGQAPVTLDAFSNIILAKLRTMHLDELAALPDVTEGLHYKISDAALKAVTLQELLSLIKSKRYPLTRLQRIIVHALLGTTKNKMHRFDQSGPLYARILAFNNNGRQLLRELGKHSTIPVITKTSHYLNSKQKQCDALPLFQDMLAYDITATDLYALGYPNHQWRKGGQDYQTSPRYIAD